MNFSALSNQSLLGRILRQPLRMIPPHAPMPILQGRLRGKRWIAGSHTHGCWLGNYEIEKQKLFEMKVGPEDVVFDIGANAGFYTLLASELVGPQGRVFSFEPLPRNINYLREHLRLNQVTNVEVIEIAVSDKTGDTFFDDAPGSAMGHISTAGELRIRTESIDALVSNGKLLPPSLMKIDVEGDEFMVLSGAQSTIRDYQPVILLATHGTRVHQQCCQLLQSWGYRLEGIGGELTTECDELIASPS